MSRGGLGCPSPESWPRANYSRGGRPFQAVWCLNHMSLDTVLTAPIIRQKREVPVAMSRSTALAGMALLAGTLACGGSPSPAPNSLHRNQLFQTPTPGLSGLPGRWRRFRSKLFPSRGSSDRRPRSSSSASCRPARASNPARSSSSSMRSSRRETPSTVAPRS